MTRRFHTQQIACGSMKHLPLEAIFFPSLNASRGFLCGTYGMTHKTMGWSTLALPLGPTMGPPHPSRDDDSVDLLPGSALFLLEIKISEAKTKRWTKRLSGRELIEYQDSYLQVFFWFKCFIVNLRPVLYIPGGWQVFLKHQQYE